MITLSNKQVRINGRKIILADTPESRLKYLDKKELDLLAAIGVNAISCTMFGGDVKDITPFKNNVPANGIDYNKLEEWYAYLKYANSKGIVPFLLLSEKENHFTLTEAQHKDFLYRIAIEFWDLSIIWQREELPTGQQTYIRNYFQYLKQQISTNNSNHLVAIHNNTDTDNFTGLNDYIDLVGLQTKLNSGSNYIKKAYDAGYAVFQSELVGGNTVGNTSQWCNLGQGMSSGAGAFFPADDLKAPRYLTDDKGKIIEPLQLHYAPVYKIMVQELGGTPTNTQEPITLKTFASPMLTINEKYKLQLQ